MAWRLNAGNETEVMDARGRNVARAHCGGSYGVKLDEAEAHARLIAAAPDLLAALEDALPWLTKADIDGAFDSCALPLGGRKAWEQIERAIAKAKGKA